MKTALVYLLNGGVQRLILNAVLQFLKWPHSTTSRLVERESISHMYAIGSSGTHNHNQKQRKTHDCKQ